MNILLLANGTFLYSLGWLAMLLGVIVDCGADGEVCGRCVLSVLTCSGGSDCCWGDDGRVSASSWWAAHFSSSSSLLSYFSSKSTWGTLICLAPRVVSWTVAVRAFLVLLGLLPAAGVPFLFCVIAAGVAELHRLVCLLNAFLLGEKCK